MSAGGSERSAPTKAQLDELRRLARGRQTTYGSARTRVQNNLVIMRLARFLLDGKPLDGVTGPLGFKHFTDECEITEAGRAALAEYDAK